MNENGNGITGEASYVYDPLDTGEPQLKPGKYVAEFLSVGTEWKRKLDDAGELKPNVSRPLVLAIDETEDEEGRRREMTAYLCIGIIKKYKKGPKKGKVESGFKADSLARSLLEAKAVTGFKIAATNHDEYREQVCAFFDNNVLPNLPNTKIGIVVGAEPDDNFVMRNVIRSFIPAPEIIKARAEALSQKTGKKIEVKNGTASTIQAAKPTQAEF